MIRYIPHMESILWSRKSQKEFDNIEDLRLYIADHFTRLSHFVGDNHYFHPADVVFKKTYAYNAVMFWKEHFIVFLSGRIVGYCGE